MPVLSVKNLSKHFHKPVLNQISFSLNSGEVLCLLGANGSGKTTILQSILGLIPVETGDISFFNQQRLSSLVLKRIGFLPECTSFYPHLTGEELLLFYAQLTAKLTSKDLKSKVSHLLKKLHLYARKDCKLKTYSKGMLQKIGIAQALVHDPDILLLDEPFAGGLDMDSRFLLQEILQSAVQNGTSILFSTHDLSDMLSLCHRVIFLKDQKVQYRGSLDKFLNQFSQKRNVAIREDLNNYLFVEKKLANLLK